MLAALGTAEASAVPLGRLYETVHVFDRKVHGPHSPVNPQAPLLMAGDGAFYSTSRHGGKDYLGTVYRLSADGVVSVLHEFKGQHGGDGAYPCAGLILASNGVLYGTTLRGGTYDIGTVFSITMEGRLRVLHSFDGFHDGSQPFGPLFEASDGQLYGTTLFHGFGAGCVYRMTLDGELAIIHVFKGGARGDEPHGGVVETPDGLLYGSTFKGGRNGYGTLWRMDKSGGFQQLHHFNFDDGWQPQSSLTLTRDDELFGVTSLGGAFGAGAVFHLGRDGHLSLLASLDNFSEGRQPYCGLLEASDGHFYLTTSTDGHRDAGSVVRVTRKGRVRIVHKFRHSGPLYCHGSLIEDPSGRLLGTAAQVRGAGGAIYSLSSMS